MKQHYSSMMFQGQLKPFKPDKINYGAFGDKIPHLHMHLVPKHEGRKAGVQHLIRKVYQAINTLKYALFTGISVNFVFL
jgi:diadenosine tetraphosphate (Ap4A) HIT family hydrolase